MLKISSQRLPIHFTSNYTFRNRISYILIYLRNIHDYYFKNRNFKLIIILTTKSYLKGIFASLMILTNNSFKLCVFATNISYKVFLHLLFFCTSSFKRDSLNSIFRYFATKMMISFFRLSHFYHANFR